MVSGRLPFFKTLKESFKNLSLKMIATIVIDHANYYVRTTSWWRRYEKPVAESRDGKRATLSPLLQTPHDPTILIVFQWWNVSFLSSSWQRHLCFPRGWTGGVSLIASKCIHFGHYLGMRWQALGNGEHHWSCWIALQKAQDYSLSIREGELHWEWRL